MKILSSIGLIFSAVSTVYAASYDYSPAFPVPQWQDSGPRIPAIALRKLSVEIDKLVSFSQYDTSSVSVELTSSTETLWTHYHTAREQDDKRPGVQRVDGNSQYRIASITKTFTTLAILYLHAAGSLSLDDPVARHIPEFAGEDGGKIPWKDITIRALASQLSGIPREFGQSDLLSKVFDASGYGLPPVSRDVLAPCQRSKDVVCDRKQLLEYARKFEPLMAPNQQSTYSNLNFELLGIVIENVSGMSFNDFINEKIFEPLNMSSSSLETPSDEHAVLPKGDNYWDYETGALAPTGGIYSSSTDLSKYLRYVLTHYNAIATGVNWIMPASWSTGLHSFYGMPFEIFRTDKVLLESRRPVTYVNKGGSLPGYFSTITLMPEYNLGITILVGGTYSLLPKLIESVTVAVTRAAETAIWKHMEERYTRQYRAVNASLNSSMEVISSASKGLVVATFISNGTDVLSQVLPELGGAMFSGADWRAQLVPTLLYMNESSQQGEIFRLVIAEDRPSEGSGNIWDDFSPTDLDVPATYGGLPLNEVVIWHEQELVELPAWRLMLKATGRKHLGDNTQTTWQLPIE